MPGTYPPHHPQMQSREKKQMHKQNEVTPSTSSNQQTAGLCPSLYLPPLSSSDFPSPLPLAPSPLINLSPAAFCLLSHPCPHLSASPPPSPLPLFHLLLFTSPSLPLLGRLPQDCSADWIRRLQCRWLSRFPLKWPKFPDWRSSRPFLLLAHASVLLISDLLLSALSTFAANLRAGFGAIFLRLQSPLFHLITVKSFWHVGKDKAAFSLLLPPPWQLNLIENCLHSPLQMSSEDRAQTVTSEVMAPAAYVPNCFDSPYVRRLFCHKRAAFITVTWKMTTKWINFCIHYSRDGTQDWRTEAKPKIS